MYPEQRTQWTPHRLQVLEPAHIFEFRLESWHRCDHDHVRRVRGRVPGHVLLLSGAGLNPALRIAAKTSGNDSASASIESVRAAS